MARTIKPGHLIHLIHHRDYKPCSAKVIRISFVTKAHEKGDKNDGDNSHTYHSVSRIQRDSFFMGL
jgi:hypothetical protein